MATCVSSPQAAALRPCSGCVLRGLLLLRCPLATVGCPGAAKTPTYMHSQWRLCLLVGLQGLWVSWPRRQVDRPFWVLEQAWSSLDCLEMAREVGGNRTGLGGSGQLRGPGGPAQGLDWGDTGRRSGRQNGGGLSYFLPGSLAGGLVASGTWERTPVSCLLSPLS